MIRMVHFLVTNDVTVVVGVVMFLFGLFCGHGYGKLHGRQEMFYDLLSSFKIFSTISPAEINKMKGEKNHER